MHPTKLPEDLMSNNAVISPPVEPCPSVVKPRIGPGHMVLFVLLALALFLPALIDNPSHQNVAILILMAAQMGVAWNIVGGYAGQVSLGQAAFYGIGAYTSTLLLLQYALNPWLAMLAGGVIAAAISLVIGWSCFRLKGHYFAMATIAVAEIIQIVFTNWEFAGGAVGLTIPMDKQGWAVFIFSSKLPYYYIALGLLLLTLLANFLIERSYFGYYFRAIKDEPDAARSLGVNLRKYKLIAFAPASVLGTGLSIKMALVSILGGIGTLFGPVLGAGILTLIDEGTRALFGGSGRGTDLIIYAALIIAVAVYYPNGVIGWFKNLAARRKAQALQTSRGEHQ
jgi:branched-chain amino acid transport system permease protein